MAKKKPPETPGTTGEVKKKSKKKLLLVLLVVVLAAAGFGYKTMTKKPVGAGKDGPTTTVAGPLAVQASLTVNLRDSHYLEFTAALETAVGKSATVLTTDQPIVLDILNAQAGAMTEPELLAPGGPAQLKAHIVGAFNREWPGLVVGVYFEQFVMQ
jgi:flagellar protein FliL